MKGRKVHITRLDGKPCYNRLRDDGTNVVRFDNGHGFVDLATGTGLVLVPGWFSSEEWESIKRKSPKHCAV